MIEQATHRGQSPQFLLFGTLGCHLCEEAARELVDVLPVDGVTVREVDIALDDGLMAQYGENIPVLRRCSDGRELYWPFSADDVRALLGYRDNSISS
ncbi:glutaredoxin family protein [Aquisalimonas sp. 2447]|uniref:glutaredoxin family protein n=1 Tax=Aquisalimonas sp. 2447 TaxID=2740807 RepID=UPI0014325E30|nr:glutaredoxin family protein [Aquisalimonas sp. 2447]QIT55536.1 glutaredoxin family protein [Aquisalimonas sp. 2447]